MYFMYYIEPKIFLYILILPNKNDKYFSNTFLLYCGFIKCFLSFLIQFVFCVLLVDWTCEGVCGRVSLDMDCTDTQ